MEIAPLHRWPGDTREAIALQRELAPRVRLQSPPAGIRTLAGADVAFSPGGAQVIAGVVVWDLLSQTVIDEQVARTPCRFPYVPGLLSFREIPGVLAAFRKLRTTPDAVLCDAQGLAHPRRLGLACHLGLWLGIPTVGCAKSRLCGQFDEPATDRGAQTPLLLDGEVVGCVLRTRARVKPLFVSPGHLCDCGGAAQLTMSATTKYRLPEPTRRAHLLVSAARK